MKLNTDRKFPANMVNAHTLLLKAKRGEKGNSKGKRYAVPAFNVTTFQGINAAIKACELLGSSGLLAFSNSALKHIGDGDQTFALELLSGYIEKKAHRSSVKIATHLDHGDYITEPGRKVLQSSIRYLTSVMADNSTDHINKRAMPLKDNIDLTREVVNMAHPLGLSVEGELGVLAGEEDEDTKSEFSTYTNPEELEQFLNETGVLMLAPTIGTMHGPNKGKPGQKVKKLYWDPETKKYLPPPGVKKYAGGLIGLIGAGRLATKAAKSKTLRDLIKKGVIKAGTKIKKGKHLFSKI